MRIKASVALVGGLGFILATIPLLGHHSFAAQFDRNKPANLTGPVIKIEWINPHARFFMDAKDASGKVVRYEIELTSTAGLLRRGWTRNSLTVGDTVTVIGSMAKDGSNVANATTVTLSDGKPLLTGSSGGGP